MSETNWHRGIKLCNRCPRSTQNYKQIKIQGKHSLFERVVCGTNLVNNKNRDMLYPKPINAEGSNFMTRLRIVCNPTNNVIYTSLFIGLALSGSLNLVLFYISKCKMHITLSLFMTISFFQCPTCTQNLKCRQKCKANILCPLCNVTRNWTQSWKKCTGYTFTCIILWMIAVETENVKKFQISYHISIRWPSIKSTPLHHFPLAQKCLNKT